MSSSTKQTIEIIVGPTGATTIETRGFQGASCREASRFIEQALGQRTGERLTTEFYQMAPLEQHHEQRS